MCHITEYLFLIVWQVPDRWRRQYFFFNFYYQFLLVILTFLLNISYLMVISEPHLRILTLFYFKLLITI